MVAMVSASSIVARRSILLSNPEAAELLVEKIDVEFWYAEIRPVESWPDFSDNSIQKSVDNPLPAFSRTEIHYVRILVSKPYTSIHNVLIEKHKRDCEGLAQNVLERRI
jgi:hypothetical protein